MRLFEVPTEKPKKQKKMVKTSLVGFCWPCQQAHIKEETYRENGELCCKRVGYRLLIEGFHPPIPIEACQEDIEKTLASWGSDEPIEESTEPLSRTEEIEEFLGTLALIYDIDTEKHQKHWEYLVSQFIALADTKQPRVAKKINKAALGTQLTLLEQDEEREAVR